MKELAPLDKVLTSSKQKFPSVKYFIMAGDFFQEPKFERRFSFMDKIENYIIRFFKSTKIRDKYDMTISTWRILAEKAKENPTDATGTTFLYGYAKGYRAAMAEMRKGGAA